MMSIWNKVREKHYIQTIGGVTELRAAMIWAEMGDVDDFKHPDPSCTVKIPIIGTFQYINQSKIIMLISHTRMIFSHDRAGLCSKISSG